MKQVIRLTSILLLYTASSLCFVPRQQEYISAIVSIRAGGYKSLETLTKEINPILNGNKITWQETNPAHYHMTLASFNVIPKPGLTNHEKTQLQIATTKALKSAGEKAVNHTLAYLERRFKKKTSIRLEYANQVDIFGNIYVVASFKSNPIIEHMVDNIEKYLNCELNNLVQNGTIVKIEPQQQNFKAHVTLGKITAGNYPGTTINTNTVVSSFTISRPDVFIGFQWRQ